MAYRDNPDDGRRVRDQYGESHPSERDPRGEAGLDWRRHRDSIDDPDYGFPRWPMYGERPGSLSPRWLAWDEGREEGRAGATPGERYPQRYDQYGYRDPRGDAPYRRRRDDLWERATDEVASWFGDEEAARRRSRDMRGLGPRGYKRSDERIHEDVSERLTDDSALDATHVEVSVKDGEVTLGGSVVSRRQKRRAEDCVADALGVTHVQNNLRVREAGPPDAA